MSVTLIDGERIFYDLTGQRFGRLEVLKFYGKAKTGHSLWLCDCDCGNEKIVAGQRLRNGSTQSCGCICRPHGSAGTPEYEIWKGMNQRCSNPKHISYSYYGGRGISVSRRWQGRNGFQNFIADMGRRPTPQHSIDRRDNDGDYCAANCRWATKQEQVLNRRPLKKAA
jgi:hypothetical protein